MNKNFVTKQQATMLIKKKRTKALGNKVKEETNNLENQPSRRKQDVDSPCTTDLKMPDDQQKTTNYSESIKKGTEEEGAPTIERSRQSKDSLYDEALSTREKKASKSPQVEQSIKIPEVETMMKQLHVSRRGLSEGNSSPPHSSPPATPSAQKKPSKWTSLTPSQVLRSSHRDPGKAQAIATSKPFQKLLQEVNLARTSSRSMHEKCAGLLQHIPMRHLLAHPQVCALPPAKAITTLLCFKELSQFKESSVQWDLLHIGRLTTSKVAAVLGIYEPYQSTLLGIPKSLSGSEKARKAYCRLLEMPIFKTLKGARKVLIEDLKHNDTFVQSLLQKSAENHHYATFDETRVAEMASLDGEHRWTCSASKGSFPYDYHSFNDPIQSKGLHTSSDFDTSNLFELRTKWGHLHEPTGILIAVNHFGVKGATIHESGLYPSEALIEDSRQQSLFQALTKTYSPASNRLKRQLKILQQLKKLGCSLGATPDGEIHHPQKDTESDGVGQVEVLEVKNHAPFRNGSAGLKIHDYDLTDEVPVWFLPQLQLEIFCRGFECRSGILIRVTATKGAKIYRIKRDDEFILLMLDQIQKFYETCVKRKKLPEVNFSQRSFLCKKIVTRLNEMKRSCVVLKHLSPKEIQRHPKFNTSCSI